MSALDAMLAAHVQFELDRWGDERLGDSIAEEVQAGFEWLAGVTLDQLAPAPAVLDRLALARAGEIPEAVLDVVADAVGPVRAVAAADDTPVSEIVPREVFDEYATLVIDMQDARRALIRQVTTSEVYSQLIAHVLYHGIKNYLVSESPIARRIWGASSLMRLGQKGLSSTGLERGIDRQLTAFVNGNIGDSIRESNDYLDSVLDERLLGDVAAELWASNADATVADAVALVPDDTAAGFVAAGRMLVDSVRGSDSLWSMVERTVEDWYADHGARPVGDLLAEAGVTPQVVADAATEVAAPAVAQALADGYLEGRIRARLQPFYESYRGRVTVRARSARS